MPTRSHPRPRRGLRVVGVGAAAVLLAGCGSSGTGSSTTSGSPTSSTSGTAGAGLRGVSVTGAFDQSPQVTWTSGLDVASGGGSVTTLTQGTGHPLHPGGSALVNWWAGDGSSRRALADTFGDQAPGFELMVGASPAQPRTVDDLIADYLSTKIPVGTPRGSRLVITANAADVFGQNISASPITSQGITATDGLLFVADVLPQAVLPHPDGTHPTLPSWAPKIDYQGFTIKGMSFTGTPEPTDALRMAYITKGSGAPVASGDVIVANYLGQVYGADQPFDESYDRTPFSTGIGFGQVIKGWDQALVGVPVGSRVLLSIPPDLGYGAAGQPSAGITGTDTLFFVIDVLAAG